MNTFSTPTPLSPLASPKSKGRVKLPDDLVVLTNQLFVELPDDWSRLLAGYSVWRYRLSESQNNHRRFADKNFFGRFTNAYKNQFDHPHYFFTFDAPRAALYALLPHGHQPEPWMYRFGDSPKIQPEEIVGEMISPDEVRPHVLLKLMLALCFYDASRNEQERRVCQSKFYLRVTGKSDGSSSTAIELQPSVADVESGHLMTLTVEANRFVRLRSTDEKPYIDTNAYYELFDSRGHTYLRQIRPNQVASFDGDLYRKFNLPGKKAKASWHTDGAKYKESRSYLVRHVQERLSAFLPEYGFRVNFAEELMHKQLALDEALPLQRFGAIQVLDNRLNQTVISGNTYEEWLAKYHFATPEGLITLPFEWVDAANVDAGKPLLVLNDVAASAFGHDEKGNPRLLTGQGLEDPYRVLYRRLPSVVKQSLNVNPNDAEDFTVAEDYLRYGFSTSTLRPLTEAYREASPEQKKLAGQASALARNLEVCLSELWLKWVIAGKVTCSPGENCLPCQSNLSNAWGFVTDDLLLYFEQGRIQFADLATPDGKRLLKERFTAWSEVKKQYMARTQKNDEKADVALPNCRFVLIGNGVLEIEHTPTIAMPNWPVIKAIKAENPAKSARSREAIGVYAGGIWYNEQTKRYIVSGTESSAGTEERGHHFYQIHPYGPVEPIHVSTLVSLLSVTFVRKNRYTVWPYPFDLIRLHRELKNG